MPRTKNAPFQRNRGRLRIIGGQWKRHTLYFNGGADLRPTPDAIREKLFNWLAPVIEGAYCLDLFCGSGPPLRARRGVHDLRQELQVLEAGEVLRMPR